MKRSRTTLTAFVTGLVLAGTVGWVATAEGGPPWARLDGNNFFTGVNNFFNSDDFGFSVTSDGAGASILASANGDGNAVMGFANGTGAGIAGRATADDTIGVSGVAEAGTRGGFGMAAGFEDPIGDGAGIFATSFSPHAPPGWFSMWSDNADALLRVSQSATPGGPELGAFVVGNHGSVEISGDVELTGSGPSQSGNLTAAGTIFAQGFVPASSARLKDNIATLNDPLLLVDAMRGVSFDWKSTGRHDIGVVAEEIALVVPEIVRYESTGEARGVDYDKLTAILIEAVKAQQAQIEQLQARLDGMDTDR